MAVRWKAGQRRKRWTEQGVVLPRSILLLLSCGDGGEEPEFLAFKQQLLAFGQLPSTYAQIAATKSLSDTLLPVLESPSSSSSSGIAIRLFVEILFLENSRPLHRGLLSTLSRIPQSLEPLVSEAFVSCCRDYGEGSKHHHHHQRRFAVVGVATSLSSLPQRGILTSVIKRCIGMLAMSACVDVGWVLRQAQQGGRPPPNTMEDCQDAVGSLYYLLQHFAESFMPQKEEELPETAEKNKNQNQQQQEEDEDAHNLDPEEQEENGMQCMPRSIRMGASGGESVYRTVVRTLLQVLQTSALSRDCVVAAGVGLCAAAQFGMTGGGGDGVALLLAKAIFSASLSSDFVVLSRQKKMGVMSSGINSRDGFDDDDVEDEDEEGMLNAAIAAECSNSSSSSSLAVEVAKFTQFGRLCFLRGLLTGLPRPTLNVPLVAKKTTQKFCPQDHQEEAFPQYHKKETCTQDNDKEATCPQEDHKKANCNNMMSANAAAAADGQVWILLYNGILPALCELCESSVDSHFKFHTVTTMQMCLQQVRASITGGLTRESLKRLLVINDVALGEHHHHHIAAVTVHGYKPLPASMISRILQIVWNNWEDPLTQTVKQVQAVFDLLVDVQSVLAEQRVASMGLEEEGMDSEDFVQQVAANLLAEGRYRKGKYVPLASLAQRIGSLKLLQMSPNLLLNTFHAQSDDDVCCAASTFLKIFLERLKTDCWSSAGGIAEGDSVFRQLWIPPLLLVLLSGDPRLRSNLNTYALPVAFQIDADSLLPVLGFILDGANEKTELNKFSPKGHGELEGAIGLPLHLTLHQQVSALISVLKVARALALIDREIEQPALLKSASVDAKRHDENVVVWVKNTAVEVPLVWLEHALTHLEDSLRVDAAELLCLNPKTASMPSALELRMLRMSIPLNMRCSSTSFRMHWTRLLHKFFLRVRTAAWRQHRLNSTAMTAPPLPQDVQETPLQVSYGDKLKQKKSHLRNRQEGALKSNSSLNDEIVDTEVDQAPTPRVTVAEIQDFLQWLSQMLLSSLYPSAPYERKYMAMDLLNAMIEVWSLTRTHHPDQEVVGVADDFSPYHSGFLSVELTLVVVGAVVDSWDKLREGAFQMLVKYPTPLPGLDSPSLVRSMLEWGKGLVNSARVRESDAGALVLRLVFRKYVLDLGWTVKVHEVTVDDHMEGGQTSGPMQVGIAVARYVDSLSDWLEWDIEEADRDLLKACKHSFVHGVLLVLRYTMEEVPWTSADIQTGAVYLRAALHRIITLLLRVTTLALWVVSANALNLPPGMISESQSNDLFDMLDVDGDEQYTIEEGGSPTEQVIMVGCWLSMKEVSLLLGTIARGVPLPGCSLEESTVEDDKVEEGLLNTEQLEAMGEHFLQVLLAMKHNGAIDKTRAGFIALCDRLLRSQDPRLNRLPETWMQQLLKRTGAKGQTVDNLLRRSAGIPAAFLALFLAEPDGGPKKLLPMGMRWVINTAQAFVTKPMVQSHAQEFPNASALEQKVVGKNEVMGVVEKEARNGDLQLQAVKERDEGVVPTVHAFNVMRIAYHDTNLATDTSGFCADGLITAIQAFSSPYWEVRNSATLAFTALVHRTIGFLNVYKRESARRAITGFEFFHRFPSLHPFLLQELQSATFQLEQEAGCNNHKGNGMASTLHPSLGPVLIILSRLKPSVISSSVDDWLSPSAFQPYVTSCATEHNLHVRVLAASALAPLVPSHDLALFTLNLAKRLPTSPDLVSGFSSFNTVHGVLLQISVLLTANCASLPDLDLRKSIVTDLFKVLKTCLWLGSIQYCCCYMVIAAFYSVLEGSLEVAKSCHEVSGRMGAVIRSLQTHLLHLCSECLEDVPDNAANWHLSMQVTVRERAAKLYFSTILPLISRKELPLLSNNNSLKTLEFQGGQEEEEEFGSVKPGLVLGVLESRAHLSFEHLGCMFKKALSHRMYEVRLATLKVLKKFSLGLTESTTSGAATWVGSFLQPLLVKRLHVESLPGCIRHTLHVIFAWRALSGEQSSIADLSTSLVDLWNRVLNIYRASKQTKTREVAMRCMGACLHQMLPCLRQSIEEEEERFKAAGDKITETQTSQAGCSDVGQVDKEVSGDENGPKDSVITDGVKQVEYIKKVISEWVLLVNEHSAASESISFRQATAEAIVASGLLEEAHWVGSKIKQWSGNPLQNPETDNDECMAEWYGRLVLEVWCVSLKLLEDEDVELRQNLALSLLQVLASSAATTPALSGQHMSAAVPMQVERVVQLVFDYLNCHFGHWRFFWETLTEWILGTEDVATLLVCDVNLVRRLFDKEIDNHHEEELLFVQLCCSHLQQLVDVTMHYLSLAGHQEDTQPTLNLEEFKSFQARWRVRFLEQAKSCAQLSIQLQGRMQWVGGVTNHQDVFKLVYRSLLGLLTLAGPCDESHKLKLKGKLVELRELLLQLPLNPLVSNALFKVLQAYERHLDVDLGATTLRASMGNVVCNNFEPFFLI